MNPQKLVQSFLTIFRDDNTWNEKTIIGFLSFTIMVIIAGIDVVTGLEGKNLEIKEYIYQSFVWITIGSFGIAGLEKFSPVAKMRERFTVDTESPGDENS